MAIVGCSRDGSASQLVAAPFVGCKGKNKAENLKKAASTNESGESNRPSGAAAYSHAPRIGFRVTECTDGDGVYRLHPSN